MKMLLRILLLFVALAWVGGAFESKADVPADAPYHAAEDGSGPPPWPRP
jgi:hypothetical protein